MKFYELKDGEIYPAPSRILRHGMLIANPTEEVYRLLGFYPMEETPKPTLTAEEVAMPLYTLDTERQCIVQSWKIQEPIKVWSKLKIVQALYAAGLFEQFMAMLNANALMKALWDASNVIESNSLFAERLPAIAEGMGKTEDEIRAMLANCLAE